LSLSTSLFPSPPPLRNLPSFPTRRSSDLQKIQGRPFTVVGDGTQTRDFVFVTDVARAFLLAAESAVSGQVFNVGAGNPQRINRLVELLGGPVVHVPARPGEPASTWADIRKAQRDLGWKPVVSFEEGVA